MRKHRFKSARYISSYTRRLWFLGYLGGFPISKPCFPALELHSLVWVTALSTWTAMYTCVLPSHMFYLLLPPPTLPSPTTNSCSSSLFLSLSLSIIGTGIHRHSEDRKRTESVTVEPYSTTTHHRHVGLWDSSRSRRGPCPCSVHQHKSRPGQMVSDGNCVGCFRHFDTKTHRSKLCSTFVCGNHIIVKLEVEISLTLVCVQEAGFIPSWDPTVQADYTIP